MPPGIHIRPAEGPDAESYCSCGYPLNALTSHSRRALHAHHHLAVDRGIWIPRRALQAGILPDGVSIVPSNAYAPARLFSYRLLSVFASYTESRVGNSPQPHAKAISRDWKQSGLVTIAIAEQRNVVGWLALHQVTRVARWSIPTDSPLSQPPGDPCDTWAVQGIFTVQRHRGKGKSRLLIDAAARYTQKSPHLLAWCSPFTTAGWQLAANAAGSEILLAAPYQGR